MRAGRLCWSTVGLTVTMSGCLDFLTTACTTELRSNLVVEVTDATGEPIAIGAFGFARHSGGEETELFSIDEGRLGGAWSRERAGDYRVEVRRPGFQTAVVEARVREDECHVTTATVRVELAADPNAVAQSPVAFEDGPQVGVSVSQVGLQLFGDTLEISGAVRSGCQELQPVAFLTGDVLEVQLRPSGVPLDSCSGLRQFRLRYVLPPERTYVNVTNAVGLPAVLFEGYLTTG